jgi:hypothetical protein
MEFVSSPLDFSYMEIKSFTELVDLEPTVGFKKVLPKRKTAADGGDETKKDGDAGDANSNENDDDEDREYIITQGLRVPYNEINSWNGFYDALEDLTEDPADNMRWLDLSHNHLTR